MAFLLYVSYGGRWPDLVYGIVFHNNYIYAANLPCVLSYDIAGYLGNKISWDIADMDIGVHGYNLPKYDHWALFSMNIYGHISHKYNVAWQY